MVLERWIAVFFLTFSLIYGYAAWNYPLLPFERNMAFLPNSLPIALSGLGILLAILLLLFHKPAEESGEAQSDISFANLGDYKVGQALAILVAMIAYALLLRPAGFVPSTIAFLVGCGFILGERRWHIMIAAAAVGAGGIWYLAQEVLGIYLKPLPAFLG